MRILAAVLFCLCLSGLFPQQSRATHVYGGEITYEAVAPGIFVATYTFYYSMSNGIPNQPTIDLNLRAPGCSAGRTVTVTHQGNAVLYVNGGTGNNCPAGPAVAIGAATYTGNFSLQASLCPEWYLSVKECPKRPVENIPVAQNACLYIEATINSQSISLPASAPEFLPPASLVFNVHSPATYSTQAIRQGSQPDSISYALKPALNEHNLPLTYTANTTFSQPLPTSSGVSLNPVTGLMTFTPNVYQSNGTGFNLYTVVVEATAYRKIFGVYRKVGASQRSLPVFIADNPGNAVPELVQVTANGQPVPANGVITVMAGNAVNMQLGTADANAGDVLTLIMPGPQIPGSPVTTTSSATAGSRPTGTLTLQTPLHAAGQGIYFPVMVMDNACPVRGVTTRIFGLQLIANPLGQKRELTTATNFTAWPNPFTKEIHFKFDPQVKAESIEIYNLLGQKIDKILIPERGAGEQQIFWTKAPDFKAGTYVARLMANGKPVQTLKFTKLQ